MAKTSRLWRLIEQWMDGHQFRPSQAKVAEAVGVAPTALSQWKSGKTRPQPAHLRKLAEVTGIDYQLLLAAVNADEGYLREEEMPKGGLQDGRQPEAEKMTGETPADAPLTLAEIRQQRMLDQGQNVRGAAHRDQTPVDDGSGIGEEPQLPPDDDDTA